MQMHAQDRAANSIDRGLATMAGSFGPVSTRAAIMGSAQPEDDRIRAMNEAMPIVQQQQMIAAAPAMAQMLSGGQGGIGGAGQVDPAALRAIPPAMIAQLWQDKMKSGIAISQQQQEEKNTDLLEAQQKIPAQLTSMGDMDTRFSPNSTLRWPSSQKLF